jgi:hypothetical protein
MADKKITPNNVKIVSALAIKAALWLIDWHYSSRIWINTGS